MGKGACAKGKAPFTVGMVVVKEGSLEGQGGRLRLNPGPTPLDRPGGSYAKALAASGKRTKASRMAKQAKGAKGAKGAKREAIEGSE